jgi:hypothetical protein
MPPQNSLSRSGLFILKVNDAQVVNEQTMHLARAAIYPELQDPNVHVEQDTTLRIMFLLTILPVISDTITVTVTLPTVVGATQAIRGPSPEISPPVHDHS